MIQSSYHELFATIAAAAATLTGLLFVALSVAGARERSRQETVVQQVRASAALIAFTSALTVSLFGLIPGVEVGIPATVLGVSGILFTLAAVRSIFSVVTHRLLVIYQLPLMVVLLVVFGCELAAGISLINHPQRNGALESLGEVLVVSLIVGIARSWELVGDRNISTFASLATLLGIHAKPAPEPFEDATPTAPRDAAAR